MVSRMYRVRAGIPDPVWRRYRMSTPSVPAGIKVAGIDTVKRRRTKRLLDLYRFKNDGLKNPRIIPLKPNPKRAVLIIK
jgi:hypothetical protein